MLKLHGYWRSSAAYRVRIGFNLKQIAYESAPVDISPKASKQREPAFLALNAHGRVPALETDAGVLTQSMAILEWLEDTHPEPSFLPKDAWGAAQVRAFAFAIACDIHPLNNLPVLGRLRKNFGADEDAVNDWIRHWIALTFAALERQLERTPATPYCFGDTPTLADICLVPQCYNARRFGLDLTAFPRLFAIDQHAQRHPSFAAAAPERQPDAPPSPAA